jgi:putative spermidine/putrescine transport system permease protein
VAEDLTLSSQLSSFKVTGANSRTGYLRNGIGDILPIAPLVIFLLVFFLWPISAVFVNAFKDNDGTFTWSNYLLLFQDPYRRAFYNSVRLGIISALTGAIPGALIALIIEKIGGNRLKKIVASVSGVLANTGGVPLAFMFLAAFGPEGLATLSLKALGIDIYGHGFTLFSFWGLVIIYSYFQIPIMVIIFSPAIEAIRKEWHDASQSLGASNYQYWRFIGIPILIPSFIASFLLLFASAFSAFATARAMTVGNISLVPLIIGTLLDGNLTVNQFNLGYALAMGMIIIALIAMIPYLIIQRKTSRWLH